MRSVGAVQRLPLLLVLLLVGTLGVLAPAASAAIDTARVARELERTGVSIDPSFDDAIRPAVQRRLARAARAATPRTYVVAAPLVKGDRFDGKERALVTALRGRLSGAAADAVFLVRSSYDSVRVIDVSAGKEAYDTRADRAADVANYERGPDGTGLGRGFAETVERYFAAIQDPRLERRVAALKRQRAKEAEDYRRQTASRGPGGADGGGVPTLVVVLAAVLVVALLVWLLARRRGARHADDAMPVLPDRVFEHARAAQRSGLRLDAETELLQLSELLDAQPVPNREAAQDAYQRALDGYTAARRTLNGTDRIVDVVGVLVLVDMARAELARAKDLDAGRKPRVRKALCFFDPLHGRAKRTVGWERGLQVPVCAECSAAMSGRGQLDPLRDGDKPYFEADTVWARTGFGAFDDDLIGRVSRGE